MEESYEEFRGGNLEIVERRWILIVNVKLQVEWDTIVGNVAGIRPNQSNCFFLFFPFFFVLYWREISVSNLISEERFLFFERINLLIYIYLLFLSNIL